VLRNGSIELSPKKQLQLESGSTSCTFTISMTFTFAHASMTFDPTGTLPVKVILLMFGWLHSNWPVSASP